MIYTMRKRLFIICVLTVVARAGHTFHKFYMEFQRAFVIYHSNDFNRYGRCLHNLNVVRTISNGTVQRCFNIFTPHGMPFGRVNLKPQNIDVESHLVYY